MIIDTLKVVPLAQIEPEDLQICQDLLHDAERGVSHDTLLGRVSRFGCEAQTFEKGAIVIDAWIGRGEEFVADEDGIDARLET